MIVDDAKCAATTVTPSTFTFDTLGGNGTVHVSAPPNCKWNIVQGPLTTTGVSDDTIHSGTADFSFTVGATSDGPTTTRHFVIAGRRVDITQSGHGCSYSHAVPNVCCEVDRRSSCPYVMRTEVGSHLSAILFVIDLLIQLYMYAPVHLIRHIKRHFPAETAANAEAAL